MSRFRAVLAVTAVLAAFALAAGPADALSGLPGLIVQAVLIVIVGTLAVVWWQRRNMPAMAGGPQLNDVPIHAILGGLFGGGGGGGQQPPTPQVTIGQADYDTFERLLHDVTMAYAAADLSRLGGLVTQEMLSGMAGELAENASRGIVNETTDIKLLQGNLVEAWNEDDADFATVSMRYSITDALIDRKTGQIVEGSRTPEEVSEQWTFRRARGAQWLLWAVEKPQ